MLRATKPVRKVFEAVKTGSLRAGDGELRQVRAFKNIFPFSVQFIHVSHRYTLNSEGFETFFSAPLASWFLQSKLFLNLAR